MKVVYLLEEYTEFAGINICGVIHNAPRPLWGDLVDNSWDMPFIHGRHYAWLDPNGEDYEVMRKENQRSDACELRFTSAQDAFNEGLAYYDEFYPKMMSRLDYDNDDHLWSVISRGLSNLGEDASEQD